MMAKKKNDKRLNVVRRMPPLPHAIPGQPFDIRKSEAANWLLQQPDLLNYFWDLITHTGYIRYDKTLCVWTGVDNGN